MTLELVLPATPTSLLCSSQYPELLVASYNNNEDAPHEPDGVALVWNLKYKKPTPEYIFHCQVSKIPANKCKIHQMNSWKYLKTKEWHHCIFSFFQSEVMSAGFAKFHPNLVVGGTYSGQIVLWDNRSNKRTPVQRTPLSAAAHTVHVHTHTDKSDFLAESVASHCVLLCSAPSLLCERGGNPER